MEGVLGEVEISAVNASIYVGLSKEDVDTCFGRQFRALYRRFQDDIEGRIARRVDPLQGV